MTKEKVMSNLNEHMCRAFGALLKIHSKDISAVIDAIMEHLSNANLNLNDLQPTTEDLALLFAAIADDDNFIPYEIRDIVNYFRDYKNDILTRSIFSELRQIMQKIKNFLNQESYDANAENTAIEALQDFTEGPSIVENTPTTTIYSTVSTIDDELFFGLPDGITTSEPTTPSTHPSNLNNYTFLNQTAHPSTQPLQLVISIGSSDSYDSSLFFGDLDGSY